MNRETKRMLQRQGEIGPDGNPVRKPAQPARQSQTAERTGPRQFGHEVRAELRKVAWPSREEVTRYSLVVFVTLVVLMILIAGVDTILAKGVLFLYDT